ncbi:hypothetical protein ILUMI_20823 [Ignelater luminosus]|uniref:Uncharacterized protein n=1 Tax=Ignelater luminosus TaxID=2038154 RepID=A0A8K0CDM5_IGNLU|nr:hypothetical protein ILUMI_20823 [Ignelater luminosus]
MNVPVLTYGWEMWTLSKNQRARIQASEMEVLKRIAGLKLLDKVRNPEIQRRLGDARGETGEKVWQMGRVKEKSKSRPRRRWNEEIQYYLQQIGLEWNDAVKMLKDRRN